MLLHSRMLLLLAPLAKKPFILEFERVISKFTVKDNYYQVSEEDRIKIRETLSATDEDVKAKMAVLKNYASTLANPPDYIQDKRFLYAILVKCRFMEENVKEYLKHHLMGMVRYADVFQNLAKFKPSKQIGMAVPSPKLTKRFERVVIIKFLPQNFATETFDVKKLTLVAATTAMFLYCHDDAPSSRFVVDLQGFSVTHLLNFNLGLSDVFLFPAMVFNVLRGEITGFELINTPTFISALLTIARLILNPKLFLGITIHSDITSLSRNIPLEYLPSDYGGKRESTEKLLEIWDYTVEEYQSFFENVASWVEANKITRRRI